MKIRNWKPVQSPLVQMSLFISLFISIFHGQILIITQRLSSLSKTHRLLFSQMRPIFYGIRWYTTFLPFPPWGQFCKMRDLSFSPTLFGRKPKEWDCWAMALLSAKAPLSLCCVPRVNMTGMFSSYSLPNSLDQSSKAERVEQQLYPISDKHSTNS